MSGGGTIFKLGKGFLSGGSIYGFIGIALGAVALWWAFADHYIDEGVAKERGKWNEKVRQRDADLAIAKQIIDEQAIRSRDLTNGYLREVIKADAETAARAAVAEAENKRLKEENRNVKPDQSVAARTVLPDDSMRVQRQAIRALDRFRDDSGTDGSGADRGEVSDPAGDPDIP